MVNECNKAIKVCRYSRVYMFIRRYLRVNGLLVLRYLRVNGSSSQRLRGYLKVNWPLCQRALRMTCSCLPWFMVPSDCTYLHVIVYLKLFVPVWQDTWFYIDLTSESTIDCVNLHVRGKLRLQPCWLRHKILNTINVKGYLRLYVLHVYVWWFMYLRKEGNTANVSESIPVYMDMHVSGVLRLEKKILSVATDRDIAE